MLTLRFQRLGKTKYPTYRLIISEKGRDPWGTYLEKLGNYNPHDKKFVVDAERIKYWMSCGAQVSDTVYNLLLKNGIVTGDKKRRSVRLSDSRRKKLDEKKATAEKEKAAKEAAAKEKEAVAKEAAAAPAPEAAPAPVEAPAETPAPEETKA